MTETLPLLAWIIFAIAGGASAALNILLILTIAEFPKGFRLWPTPGKGSWQNFTFWPLFRTGLGATILLGALETVLGSGGSELWLRLAIGLPLAIGGLGITIYGYFDLGIDNTYGSDDGLVTGGLYRYSRNPQYVASIAGFLGLAIMAGSVLVWVLCALAIGIYALLPFAEEPWLRAAYGAIYDAYARTTPRFIGLRSFGLGREHGAGARASHEQEEELARR